MIKRLLSRIKTYFSSMRLRFTTLLVVSIAISCGVYFVLHYCAHYYVDKTYMSEQKREDRENSYIEDLQSYVVSDEVTLEGAEKLLSWTEENKYVYLIAYKADGEVLFASDQVTDNQVQTSKNGVFVRFPTLKQLFENTNESERYQLTLADNEVILVSITDFSEYRYYDVINILCVFFAVIIVLILLILDSQLLASRIIRLGDEVNRIADGDIYHKINTKGSDELSSLAQNIEDMRVSMIKNLEKEREALDSNSALITSMSHDIRTPLTVLLGYLDFMQNKADADEEMMGYLKAAESTAMRLKKLSDDMFNYFLVFGGNDMSIEMESYDAATVIDQMLFEHITLMRETGQEVVFSSFDYEALSDKQVYTDAPKLMRIFDNVFSNIYKYADKESPVTIDVGADGGELVVKIENSVSKSLGNVESNGIGLKTCKKLGEHIGVKFEQEKSEETFVAKIAIKLNETSKKTT